MSGEEQRIAERRTVARGPGGGALTPPQSVAASNPCLNCGTNVQLEYCPECGQHTIDPDPTLREFLRELAEEFFHWDGKLVTTFRLLVTKPGALTQEYLGGKRVRYISPLRLYLACSILYFFVGAIVPPPRMITNGSGLSTQLGPITVAQTDTALALASLDKMAKKGRWVGRVFGKHFGNALRHRAEIPTHLAAAIPKTMFVLVPLFAALVMFAMRRSRRRFPQHLAFALHTHAFVFLVLALMFVRRFTLSLPVHIIVPLVCIGAIVTYLVRSMRTVYDVSLGGAIGRTALVATTYFALFCVAMLATFGLMVMIEF
ncbi:MAG: DUF3667 domain-containing protein [bacterium]